MTTKKEPTRMVDLSNSRPVTKGTPPETGVPIHTLVADGHRPEPSPIRIAGHMAFIQAEVPLGPGASTVFRETSDRGILARLATVLQPGDLRSDTTLTGCIICSPAATRKPAAAG